MYPTFLSLLIILQVFLFGCGVAQLVEGKYVLGCFNVGINLIFGLLNVRNLFNAL